MNKLLLLLTLFSSTLLQEIKAQNKVDSLKQVLVSRTDDQKAYVYNLIAKEYYYKDLNKLTFFSHKADSLACVYQIDSIRIKALNNLCYAYINSGKRNEALEFNNKALELAKVQNLEKEILYTNYIRAYYYYTGGVSDSSLFYLDKAYRGACKATDSALKLKCLNIIAANYLNQGNYNEALTNFTAAYHIADSIKNKKQLTNLSLNIGTTLLYNEDLDRAIGYFENVISLSDSNDVTIAYATAYNNLGACYSRKADHKKAIYYFEKALPAFQKLNNRFQIAQTYANLGQSNYLLDNMDTASSYLNEAIKINRENKLTNQLIVNLIILGRLQINKNEFSKARQSLDEANQLTATYNINYNKSDLLNAYSLYYDNINDFKSALQYKQQELNYRDSIFNEKKQRQIVELETKFDTKLKEKENESLRKDLELQQLQTTKQKQIRNFLIVFAILIIVLIGILLNRARIKKQAHHIIQQQKLDLEIANHTKDKFFSIIAHDLRAPFNALIGFSDLLFEEYDSLDDKERKAQITEIKEASHNTFNLLNNLLSWARIQQGRIKINTQPIHLNDLFKESIKNQEASAKLKGINLSFESNNGTQVLADRSSIEIVLGNLLNNAIKFTPNGGSIIVSALESNKMTNIKVSDTGIGMPKNNINKLFQIDQSFSTPGTNEEPGTGLGLILCKEFIEMNGGEISVCSEYGKGSCFSFSLATHKVQ